MSREGGLERLGEETLKGVPRKREGPMCTANCRGVALAQPGPTEPRWHGCSAGDVGVEKWSVAPLCLAQQKRVTRLVSFPSSSFCAILCLMGQMGQNRPMGLI